MSTDQLFEEAVKLSGEKYLELEEQLRKGGGQSLQTLKKELNNSDPVNQLIAKSLLDWVEGRANENQPALDYMKGLPVRVSRTPIGTPSPYGLASYLNLHYGPRVAEILAVRLVKDTDWPSWQVVGVLLYLDDVKVHSTNCALIRFAIETKENDWRSAAIATLGRSDDPKLNEKIEAERVRAKVLSIELPDSLLGLLQTK